MAQWFPSMSQLSCGSRHFLCDFSSIRSPKSVLSHFLHHSQEQAFRPVKRRVNFLASQAVQPVHKKLIENGATSQFFDTLRPEGTEILKKLWHSKRRCLDTSRRSKQLPFGVAITLTFCLMLSFALFNTLASSVRSPSCAAWLCHSLSQTKMLRVSYCPESHRSRNGLTRSWYAYLFRIVRLYTDYSPP